jgi:type I restriction enzyme M protein
MYAANAGKSGGEFFTPQEVSELLARISLIDFGSAYKNDLGKLIVPDKKSVQKVYDPACGSGSLLLRFAKILGKSNVKQGFFGQENSLTIYNLARINMFLHDINFEKFDIAYGNTLTNPYHYDIKPFDAIVANPPYSKKWPGDSDAILINDERYSPAGVLAPKGKSDFAFVMHILSWLSSDGTAAVVEFPGVLYRGNSEKKIRKYLIENNYVDSVIQLPSDLFFGTTIATTIIVFRKNKNNNLIHFIDASKEFVRYDTKNKLSNVNIEKIVESVRNKTVTEYFSVNVTVEDVIAKDYTLSVNTYLTAEDKTEKIDITDLNQKIKEVVLNVGRLRHSIDRIVAELEGNNE